MFSFNCSRGGKIQRIPAHSSYFIFMIFNLSQKSICLHSTPFCVQNILLHLFILKKLWQNISSELEFVSEVQRGRSFFLNTREEGVSCKLPLAVHCIGSLKARMQRGGNEKMAIGKKLLQLSTVNCPKKHTPP